MRNEDRRDLEVLTFGLEGEIFAVEAESVREILDLVTVTDVPNSRPFVNGLINVRGKVVPLADLHIRLGMPSYTQSIDTRVVVIEVSLDGEPTTIGVIADKVFEVTTLTAASIEKTPDLGLKWRREFIAGIGKREQDFVIALDMERIFAMQESEVVGRPEESPTENRELRTLGN